MKQLVIRYLPSVALVVVSISTATAQPAANLGQAWGEALAEMPDWSGIWNPVGGIMFPAGVAHSYPAWLQRELTAPSSTSGAGSR